MAQVVGNLADQLAEAGKLAGAGDEVALLDGGQELRDRQADHPPLGLAEPLGAALAHQADQAREGLRHVQRHEHDVGEVVGG